VAAGGEEGDGGAAIAGDARSPELIARALRYTISRTNCTGRVRGRRRVQPGTLRGRGRTRVGRAMASGDELLR